MSTTQAPPPPPSSSPKPPSARASPPSGPASSAADTITIIRAPGRRLTKLHAADAEAPSGVRSEGYDDTKHVESREVVVSSIQEIAALLRQLESQPDSAIIRGQRRADATGLRVRRAKNVSKNGEPPGFEPKARRWMCVDLDSVKCPEGLDPAADPRTALLYLQSQLPDWLRFATCAYQWSSSAGIRGWAVLKAHLWFWLDRPVDDESLRHWARVSMDRRVDAAVYESIQIHYTAAPVLVGLPDPVGQRSGLLAGASGVVEVPQEVWGWAAREELERRARREEASRRKVDARMGQEGDDPRKKAWIARALGEIRGELLAQASEGGRHDVALKVAGSLANYVQWGWLEEDSAREMLEFSPITDIPSRDGELDRVWGHALEQASRNPAPEPLLTAELRGRGPGRASPRIGGGGPSCSLPGPPVSFEDEAGEEADEEAGEGADGDDLIDDENTFFPRPGKGWPDSDNKMALRLVEREGWRVRYGVGLGWLSYEAGVWRRGDLPVMELACLSAEALRQEVEAAWPEGFAMWPPKEQKPWSQLYGFARGAENAGKVQAAVQLARSKPCVGVAVEDLDSNPWLFNVASGTLDLRTGLHRPHTPADLITMQSPVSFSEGATCPTWLQFLSDIMEGDAEMVAFLQRAIGYSLTASTREQCFFLLQGEGSNGKSTFLSIVMQLLGSYAKSAQFQTFADTKASEGIRNDIADLRGARLVSAVEPDEGVRLAEGVVKQLTGGDTVKARFLYQEAFEFKSTFKIFLACNPLPVIRGTDNAIWRRVRLIRFNVQYKTRFDDPEEWPVADPTISERLKAELPGILCWAAKGAAAWMEEGLNPPQKVLDATDAYRESQDVLGQFIDDCCVVLASARVPCGELYAAYKAWAEGEAGRRPLPQNIFGAKIKAALPSVTMGRDKRGRWYEGLGLQADARQEASRW